MWFFSLRDRIRSRGEALSRLGPLVRPLVTPVVRKRCTVCRETKPAAEFAVDRSRKRGLKSACKACDAARHRERYAEDRNTPVRPYTRDTAPPERTEE